MNINLNGLSVKELIVELNKLDDESVVKVFDLDSFKSELTLCECVDKEENKFLYIY